MQNRSRQSPTIRWLGTALLLVLAAPASAQTIGELARRIGDLEPDVLTESQKGRFKNMIRRDIQRRRAEANASNRAEWKAIENRAQWEHYRDVRLKRLKESLGELPKPSPSSTAWHVTRVVKGDGFQIKNLVYESRPGDWVTANLYAPAQSSEPLPCLLIVHSHHRDKTHGELQDMGMTWARAGCLALVIDQVGYGERRAHPFNGPDDYAGKFKSWRQDYYYRYDSGVQLRLAGDSLMGWFVGDLMRAVGVLLAQKNADASRVVILGSVAGGGDPCAVTAALDPRVAGAVPFNFGGLQPESYPLPENAEETFNFAMSSYWDSTRGLPRTCSDGFFHWTIVASLAPRPLIYAHEFIWDREHDPVWKRFQRVYGDFYDKRENLAFAVGKGSVKDSSDVATHCTHIGRHHRRYIHPAFARWFGIQVGDDDEYSRRVDGDALKSMTREYREHLKPSTFVQVAAQLAQARLASARRRRDELPATSQRAAMRRDFAQMLGPVEPAQPQVVSAVRDAKLEPAARTHRIVLRTDEGVATPLLLFTPAETSRSPVVMAFAQSGKASFLAQRGKTIAGLIQAGVAVCLLDVRGVGETREGTSRGRTSGDVGRSVNMQMFGETMLGQRLRDVRAVLRYLRGRTDVDATRIGVWGESFAEPNSTETDFNVPHDVARRARPPEPLGGLLALLTALYEDDVDAIFIRGGLSSYASVLESPHVYVPHDAVIPQALNVGDMSDIAGAVAPKPLRMTNAVDALNRRVSDSQLRQIYGHLPQTQQANIEFGGDKSVASWFEEAIQ